MKGCVALISFQKQDNETLKEYKIRLCKNKDEYDLTWSDVADLLNSELGEKYNESSYRKWWNNYYEGYQDALQKHLKEEDVLQEFEDRKAEAEKERYRFLDQKREYRNYLRKISRIEHLYDFLNDKINDLKQSKPLTIDKIPDLNNSKREGLLNIADWHKGMDHNSYWNIYNEEVFYKRIKKLIKYVIAYGHENKINTLHVVNLGDLIDGIIRVKTRIIGEEDVIEQITKVSEILSEMLIEFANHFPEIKFYSVLDNHSRVIPNKDENIASENFSKIIPWYLKARLSNFEQIEIVDNKYDDEIAVIDICNSKIFALHGDKDKISDVVQNWSLMLKEFPDYVLLAHKHTLMENEEHQAEVIVARSLSGVSDYSKEIRKTSKPAQEFIIFDDVEGRKCTYPIRLDVNLE